MTRTAHLHSRRGAIAVMTAMLLVVVFAFAAFSVDVGQMNLARAQLQNAADAAALAGVQALIQTGAPGQARRAAREVGELYEAAGQHVEIQPGEGQDIEIGHWDNLTRTFSPMSDGNPGERNAVRVTVRLSRDRGSQLGLSFAPVIGVDDAEVSASAIATMGGVTRDIMMVLDLSGSMASDGRIQALRLAAPEFLNAVEEVATDDHIGVMGLSVPNTRDEINLMPWLAYRPAGLYQLPGSHTAALEADLTDDFNYLRRSVLTTVNLRAAKYSIPGYTGIGACIRDATYYLTNEPEVRPEVLHVVVLMSDGEANRPRPNSYARSFALQQARYARDSEVIVHTISLGNEADVDLMQDIAEITGGTHFDATGSGVRELRARLIDAFRGAAGANTHPTLVR